MSKTIKVIDLINLISKCEQPKRIEVLGHKFSWNSLEGFYEEINDRDDLFQLTNSYPTYEFLDFEVKIEDKKEEPKIDIQGIEEISIDKLNSIDPYVVITKPEVYCINKQNEIIKAIKQLDNQINNK